jgi:hypothetical protein
MPDETAAYDVKLSDGRELVCDLDRVTLAEYQAIFKSGEENNLTGVILKTYGLSDEDVTKISLLDYKKLTKEFFRKAGEPLADPN